MRVVLSLLVFITVAALSAACSSSSSPTQDTQSSAPTPEAAAAAAGGAGPASRPTTTDGKVLFVTYCAKCHGLTGLGDGPSVGSLRVQAGLNLTILGSKSDEEIFTTISGGKGTEMPPWELILSEEQRQALVKYVRTLERK